MHKEVARADALKKAEDGGVTIKAPRGNRSQWHANFKLDEFSPSARDVPVVQAGEGGGLLLRGLLVIGPGYTLADCCKMLLTQLQLGPTGALPDPPPLPTFFACKARTDASACASLSD